MQAISLICGLGNPGDKYTETRHNAGFWFLSALEIDYPCRYSLNTRHGAYSASFTAGDRKIHTLLPQKFMNCSGQSVAPFAAYYKIPAEEILVVHDELDLAPGVIKLKKGGGHGGHNGLRDLIEKLGTKDFYRLRVGIGRPRPGQEVASYVLKRPAKDEQPLIEDALIAARQVMPDVLNGNMALAMNQLHSN